MDSNEIISKSFFKRPEGKMGIVLPLAIFAGVTYFFGSAIGDFIVNAFDNVLHLGLVGIALVALATVVLDSETRTRVFYAYKILMRWFTGLMLDISPIDVLKTYKNRMTDQLNNMIKSLDALKGLRQKINKRLHETVAELDNVYRKLQYAVEHNDSRGQSLEGKQVARLESSQKRYEESMTNLNLMITVMDRYYGLCQDTITDMDSEIKWRQTEQDEAKQYRGVVGSAKAILTGLPEKDLWDEATLKLESDYMNALGEVEGFLDVTKSILSSANLQDGVDAKKAMEKLDAWQNRNANVTLGATGNQTTKANIIQDASRQLTTGSLNSISTSVRQKQPVQNALDDTDYGNVFRSKK